MEKQHSELSPKKLRFSIRLFPLLVLVFQVVLLIFEIFQIRDIEAVNSMREFMRASKLLLSLVFALLFVCYMFITLAKKKENRDWKYTLINSGIAIANIVIVNEWYQSDKLTSALSSLLEKPVFVIMAILVLIVLTVIVLRNSKKNSPERTPTSKPTVESLRHVESTPASGPARSKNESSGDRSENNPKGRFLFFVICAFLAAIIGSFVYLIISKYDIIAPVLTDEDALTSILSTVLLFIIGIAAVIILVIVITYVAQYICKAVWSVPKFLEGQKQPEPRVVKVAFGIIGIPVFFGLRKLFEINMDWLMNLLQNRDYLVAPFTVLLYFILSMLFVEILYDLFSGKSKRKWAGSFKKIIVDAGDNIIAICGSIIGSFLNLLRFPPDFLITIESLLLGIETDSPADKPDDSPNGKDTEEKE